MISNHLELSHSIKPNQKLARFSLLFCCCIHLDAGGGGVPVLCAPYRWATWSARARVVFSSSIAILERHQHFGIFRYHPKTMLITNQ